MKTYLSVLFFFFFIPISYGGLEEINDSVCRIASYKLDEKKEMQQMLCTAFCYDQDETNVYCLTCGHCYFDDTIVGFMSHTGEQQIVVGKIVKHDFKEMSLTDYAIIVFKKADFKDYPPLRPLIFADKIEPGIIWSHGCANGGWPSMFKGVKVEQPVLPMLFSFMLEGRGFIFFSPPPAKGRSGSALLNKNYEVIGMITMNTGSFGVATPVHILQDNIKQYEQSLIGDKPNGD
jgi:hypothetical protein